MRFRRGNGILLVLALFLAAFWPIHAALADHTPTHSMEQSNGAYETGRMYENAGDLTRAEEFYQEALKLWPENQQARDALQALIESRKPVEPIWQKWLSWLPGLGTGGLSGIMEMVGLGVMVLVFVLVFFKFGKETIRLSILRAKGIPLLGLGRIGDPTGRVPGLLHQLATNMNDAGLTIYDEKGAVLPDFNFIGETNFAQAKLLVKLLEMVYSRQVQRINVEISTDDGMLNASVSLVDSANGYVRYLHVVSLDPGQYKVPGELTKIVAELVADAILIALSRDPNTRGLLYQRMGNWTNALKEFLQASETARKTGQCGVYYQAHLNLGNLYSFLGLQDKSVAAYTEVAERTRNSQTQALLQAAMACSYKNWQVASPPDQQGTYEWLARQAVEKALASPNKSPLVAYTLGCYYSLANEIEECLVWLREAVAGDLAYLDYALSDPDLENLRRWLNGRPLGEALGLRVG